MHSGDLPVNERSLSGGEAFGPIPSREWTAATICYSYSCPVVVMIKGSDTQYGSAVVSDMVMSILFFSLELARSRIRVLCGVSSNLVACQQTAQGIC